jgi:hypothetical protein
MQEAAYVLLVEGRFGRFINESPTPVASGRRCRSRFQSLCLPLEPRRLDSVCSALFATRPLHDRLRSQRRSWGCYIQHRSHLYRPFSIGRLIGRRWTPDIAATIPDLVCPHRAGSNAWLRTEVSDSIQRHSSQPGSSCSGDWGRSVGRKVLFVEEGPNRLSDLRRPKGFWIKYQSGFIVCASKAYPDFTKTVVSEWAWDNCAANTLQAQEAARVQWTTRRLEAAAVPADALTEPIRCPLNVACTVSISCSSENRLQNDGINAKAINLF